MNYRRVLAQALIISGSRLVGLSMMTVDLMILARYSLTETADFALAAQFSQVFIVLAMGLTIGVNIVFNARKDSSQIICGAIAGYALLVGVALLLLALAMAFWLDMSANARQAYLVLALGVAPTAVMLAISAMAEASGRAGWVFKLTAGAALINGALDYLFIHVGLVAPAVAVAAATTAIRLVSLVILIKGFRRTHPLPLAPIFNWAAWKELLDYGRAEAIVRLVFTAGMSFLFARISALALDTVVAQFAIGINFLNIASVIYMGMTRAIANIGSEPAHRLTDSFRGLIIFGTGFIAACSLLLYAAAPLLSWLYAGRADPALIGVFAIGVWVVAFDGLAMLFITFLRLLRWKTGPPLLRLSLVVIGVPLSLMWFEPGNIEPVFKGLMAGTLAAALCLALVLQYAITRQKQMESLASEPRA